jgi:hypothetical protein
MRRGNYKPESDFQFADLSPEIQKSILAVKPYINDFESYVQTLDISKIVEFYKKLSKSYQDIKADKSEKFIQFFTADDLNEFKNKLAPLLSRRFREILESRIDFIEDPISCFPDHISFKNTFHDDYALNNFLSTLKTRYPKDFQRLEFILKTDAGYDEDLSLTENLKNLAEDVYYPKSNSIADLMVQAEQDAYHQNYQDSLYLELLDNLGALKFENSVLGSEGAQIIANKNGVPHLFVVGITTETALVAFCGVDEINLEDFFGFDYPPDRFLKSYKDIYPDYSALDVCERFVDLTG